MTKRQKGKSGSRRDLVRQIHDELAERFAAPILIGGRRLTEALGYPSQAAFRQAHARGTLPVAVFSMKQRRGYWARTAEVAEYIAAQRAAVEPEDAGAPTTKHRQRKSSTRKSE